MFLYSLFLQKKKRVVIFLTFTKLNLHAKSYAFVYAINPTGQKKSCFSWAQI